MLNLRVKPSGGFAAKMACKKSGHFPRHPQPVIDLLNVLFGMDTHDSGGALKETLVVVSDRFVRLFFRLGCCRTARQHERAARDPVAYRASAQGEFAQV
ncbi:MAG: hypothetical protein ACE5EX_12735 [Phycisphaerae bacterium]